MPHEMDGVEIVAPKNVGGRPQKEIDLEIVRRAAGIGCTWAEIAALCGVVKSTFWEHMQREPEIGIVMDEGRETGKATLRRHQWQGAMNGNPAMLIWLGKQMLGQRDILAQQALDKDGNPADQSPQVVIYQWADPKPGDGETP